MRVIVAGSRTVWNYSIVSQAIKESGFDITEIVSGHARGVDDRAEFYARKNLIPLKVFPADWDKYGAAAGPIRNKQMAEYADALIAIWDMKSRGTKNMIEQAKKCNLQIYIYNLAEHE